MKFHRFNLMPRPDLPDGFAEKHRSVWVDVDSRLLDPVKANRVYNDYLNLLEYAADLGFNGLGINEHHQNAYGLMPSPQLTAPTLVATSERNAVVPAAHGTAWAGRIRNAQSARVADAGHLVEFEQVEVFARLVGDFVASGHAAAVA